MNFSISRIRKKRGRVQQSPGGKKLAREILPGVFQIRLPLPGERPGPVNVFLFRDDPVTLLDTGTKQTAGRLAQSLEELGLGLGDIRQVVCTHGHIDHYGAAKIIKKASAGRARLLAHAEDVRSVQTGIEVSRKRSEAFTRLMGVPIVYRVFMRHLYSMFLRFAQTSRVNATMEHGQVVQLGRYPARVIHTPGHSRGSVCFFLEEQGVLFSGDHVLPHITPNALPMIDEKGNIPHRRSQEEFYASIRRVEKLAPQKVFPGHGKAMDGLAQTADMYRRTFNERQEKLMTVLGDDRLTCYRISRRLFPNLDTTIRLTLELYLAVAEVFTHVQVLEQEGRVKTSRTRRKYLVERV